MYLSGCLLVNLARTYVCLYVCMCVFIFGINAPSLSVCLSVCLCPSVCLSLFLSLSLFSVCLSLSVCLCLSVSVSVFLSTSCKSACNCVRALEFLDNEELFSLHIYELKHRNDFHCRWCSEAGTMQAWSDRRAWTAEKRVAREKFTNSTFDWREECREEWAWQTGP